MPAEVEEAFMEAYAGAAQRLGPDPRQHLLHRRTGRLSGGAPLLLRHGALGQGPAVHFAVWRQGECRQQDEGLRDHRLGQTAAQVGAQGAARIALRVRRHDKGHQAPLRSLAPGHHRGLTHAGVPGQGRLDLTKLDAEAAHLDLVVDPAQKLDFAVPSVARQVARAVEAPARLAGEQIGPEPVRRQLRTAQVSAGQPRAADPQLTGDPDWHRLEPSVEQVDPGIGERPPDGGRCARVPRHQRAGRVGRVLGGAVEVVDAAHPGQLVNPVGQVARQRLSGQVHRPHRGREGSGPHQLGHGRGDGVDQGHLSRGGPSGQSQNVVGEDHRTAGGERDEDLEDRQVETDGGRAEHARELFRRIGLRSPGNQGHRARMTDRDPLRKPGRSRGIDEVGKLLGIVIAAEQLGRLRLVDSVQQHHLATIGG